MKRNDLLFFSITTFILIAAWVGGSIYHNVVTSTISKKTAEKIVPISPNFDTKVINQIKERGVVTPLLEGENASESALEDKEESEADSEIRTP